DANTFSEAWRAGRSVPLADIIDPILAVPTANLGRSSGDKTELSARELEVASLVSQGLTNRQIGASLFITAGTAGLHVKHILGKLGFASRAQIAAWIVENRRAGSH
ncbi:MAG TPA: LuxR C-terminal-related transcriptional regulator, partial [Chloroflexota bacterium]|nr:LuxR C-terminal-related transcriptional regulator [Chloroflexota bacterium]